ARSANVVFAKMAVKHLDADSLRKEAEKFLFNRPIWDQPVGQSSAEIPDKDEKKMLDFAKSASGFGQVHLSPMHAALIAAAMGNGMKWKVHAPFIAREALKAYLVGGPLGYPPVARVKHYRRKHR